MPRPKDENGILLPYAHVRLKEAPRLMQAAVFALSADGRLAHLTMARKIALAEAAIDHVYDQKAEPKAIYVTDPAWQHNKALLEGWRAMVDAIRQERRKIG